MLLSAVAIIYLARWSFFTYYKLSKLVYYRPPLCSRLILAESRSFYCVSCKIVLLSTRYFTVPYKHFLN